MADGDLEITVSAVGVQRYVSIVRLLVMDVSF